MEQGIQASYACATVISNEVSSAISIPLMSQANFDALYIKVRTFSESLGRFYYTNQGGQVESTDEPYPTIVASAIAKYTAALTSLQNYATVNLLTVPS